MQLPESTFTLPDEESLRASIGSEGEAARVVQSTITYGLNVLPKPMSGPQRLVHVVAEQIPERWLPAVEGVRFERVPFERAREAWTKHCLRLLWVTADVSGTNLNVSVAEGNTCDVGGSGRHFERTPKGWAARSGIGSGFGVASGECSCRGGD